ncbi:hypothetical protein Tco_1055065 [Tanacetum coccineum]|uniref:Uncharacterized protein n=1 Tax=Tanacetum coccineum TaxID=301880 RepID=A0ABQ5H0X5_9ASTR
MALESPPSQQLPQLPPSSKVNFKCKDDIIAFNNAIALLEHPNKLYHLMLSFLSNYCIFKDLTLQPSVMYVEYLKEFWYTSEVEEETKTITFLLSWWDEPLSFTKDEFISAIGLSICKDPVPLPPKEAVRARLATLGIFDKDNPTLSSIVLVAKLFKEPKQSLIPPSREVNANDTADKSLSKTSEVIIPKKQVAETQHAKVIVPTVDATKSLKASVLAKEQVNQPSAANTKKTPVFDDSHHEVSEHTSWEKNAFADFQSLSSHLDHVCEEALTKALKTEIGESVSSKVSLDVRALLEEVVIIDDHAEGEKSTKGQMDENANPLNIQGEHSNIKTANPKTTKDNTDYDELDKEPLSKKFKIMTPILNIITPTPLFSIPLEHVMKPPPQQESV